MMSPFQNGSSTSGILNKSTASGNIGRDDDLCGESESNLMIFRQCGNIVPGWLCIVLSVPRTWLIV